MKSSFLWNWQSAIFVIFLAIVLTVFLRPDPNTQELCVTQPHQLGSSITLQDGRTLTFLRSGPRGGFPIFYFHPSPTSRLFTHPNIDALAEKLDINFITIDRPGFGLSTPHPESHQLSLSDWVNDIKQLASHLGIQKFSVLGHSSGGAYALAVAHHMKDRVAVVGTIGGVALPGSFNEPWDSPDWNCWADGMRSQNKMITKLGSQYPEILKIVWKAFAPTMVNPASFNDICENEKSEKSFCQKSDFKDMLYESQVESFRQGTFNLFRELIMIQNNWGFHVNEISVPAKIWVGKYDQFTSVCMGKYLAKNIQRADLKIVETGHFSMWSDHAEEILKSVLPQ